MAIGSGGAAAPMTPAMRDTLATYSRRMGRRYAEVLREFRAESKTNQGRLLTEMRTVEAEFVVWQHRRAMHWTRRLGRWLGRALAKVVRR